MPDAPKTQLDKFKEAARELGADDDEGRFNEKLGKIAKQKPIASKKSAKRDKRA